MKTKYFLLAIGLFLAVSIAAGLSQTVPQLISYQGRLTDAAGAAITGSRQMRFEILDGDTPGSAVLWGETQDAVPIVQGLYNVMLGSERPVPLSALSGASVYLQVKVDGETLVPRRRIASVAYALRTESSANSDTLDGLDSAEFAPATHDHNDAYYTKPEVDAMVGGGDCYSKAEVDTMIAGLQSQLESLQPQVAANTGDIAALDGRVTLNEADISDLDGRVTVNEAGIAAMDSRVAANEAGLAGHETRLAAVENKLANVSVAGTDFIFSGVNVHVRNGSGSTTSVNSLGNLIVGYNETRGTGDSRTGSHNVVIGSRQNYSSYGGLAVGYWNTISGPYCSVSGGDHNTAGTGTSASVSGGSSNTASGQYSSIMGGTLNDATGINSSVGGGYSNTASGQYSGVRGGEGCSATARSATTSGGLNRSATTAYDWVGGNLTQGQ
ncbi:MAG TPA: hypothetical protein VM658_15760 [bacterium]|nr:hypothetical protein [bacterium]